MKTTLPKEGAVERRWHLVDATDRPAGRLAVRIADLLRGRTKPIYTPAIDVGDFVVVINAEKVKLTGAKEEQKIYLRYSGYPSGLKRERASQVRARKPERILYNAVKGMLPKNTLSRRQFARLSVYAGPEHPHAAQRPQALDL